MKTDFGKAEGGKAESGNRRKTGNFLTTDKHGWTRVGERELTEGNEVNGDGRKIGEGGRGKFVRGIK
jgi:hypothetical protein